MKIIFYQHRFRGFGGIENVTAALANEFVRLGNAVEIVSHISGEGQEDAQSLDKRVIELKMPVQGYYSKRNREWLQEHIANSGCDMVVFQDSYAPIENNLLPVNCNVRVVVVEHNSPLKMYTDINSHVCITKRIARIIMSPWRRYQYYKHEVLRRQFLYNHCWRYALLSDRYFGEFRMLLKLSDSRKLICLHNPCPARVPSCNKKINEVLFVGTIEKRKGCDTLLNVWKEASPQFKNWQLTFVGDGPLRLILERRVAAEGIINVHFDGYRANPSEYFRRAKVFAFPSRREGWCLVIPEALAYGCVPIAFDSFSAARDIITDDVNGFLIPPFDEGCFLSKIMMLMSNDNQRLSMSLAGSDSVERFSIAKVIDEWNKLIYSADIS